MAVITPVRCLPPTQWTYTGWLAGSFTMLRNVAICPAVGTTRVFIASLKNFIPALSARRCSLLSPSSPVRSIIVLTPSLASAGSPVQSVGRHGNSAR